MSLADIRDIVVIVAGSLAVLAFAAAFIFTVVIGLATRMLIGTVRSLLNDEVTPLVDSARLTAKRVHGTSSFVGETVARPVIRVYGVASGTRRAIAVLAGIASRRDGKRPSE